MRKTRNKAGRSCIIKAGALVFTDFRRPRQVDTVTICNTRRASAAGNQRRSVLLKPSAAGTIVRLGPRFDSREEAMFKGSFVALITPFRDGAVDETAFQEHVAWQIGQGTHGLVPIGTTGECPALEEDEQERLIALCVEVAKGRAPVIPGTGFNSTAHTIAATRAAKKAGADAALIVCPYYNKPTQEGLYQHFKAVHDAVDIPIVIYNIPGRSAVDMSNATMARLAKLPNIVGVKDATNDLARPLQDAGRDRRRVLAAVGRGRTAVAYLAQGGDGVHLGDRQCRAGALLGDARGMAEGRCRDGAADQRAPHSAARRAVCRNEPRAGQIRRLAAWAAAPPRCACRCGRPMPATQEKVRGAMRGAGLIN